MVGTIATSTIIGVNLPLKSRIMPECLETADLRLVCLVMYCSWHGSAQVINHPMWVWKERLLILNLLL